MTATEDRADRPAVQAMSGHLVARLERFWPSRRMDAFDEFCRPC